MVLKKRCFGGSVSLKEPPKYRITKPGGRGKAGRKGQKQKNEKKQLTDKKSCGKIINVEAVNKINMKYAGVVQW